MLLMLAKETGDSESCVQRPTLSQGRSSCRWPLTPRPGPSRSAAFVTGLSRTTFPATAPHRRCRAPSGSARETPDMAVFDFLILALVLVVLALGNGPPTI